MHHEHKAIRSKDASTQNNHLLAALPTADYERLLPHLESVPLPLGWALYEPDKPMLHV